VPAVPWAAVVPNAVDLSELCGPTAKEGYLVELARIDPGKGQHLAIQVARRLGLPLLLAGKLDPIAESMAYFKAEIEPHLGYDVRWIPEVRGRMRAELLARAVAMLAPLRWQEPFGLAMAEAIASGTPVVALRRGAACELVEEGLTGLLADDLDGLVAGVHRARELDSSACARRGRERFAPARMVERYEALYKDMLLRR
jgi:glycosyltransferase involved in cell wall biosynthesis